MVGNTNYYVYRNNGRVGRIAKITSGCAYGYEDGRWVAMPGLIKIQFDITDFEHISQKEAEKLIAECKA